MIEFFQDEIERVSVDREKVKVWLKDGRCFIIAPHVYIAEEQQLKVVLKQYIE